ncbi:MAG: 4-phosphoerythronate dehydrogenase [Planctomycetota bacterium]
MLIVADESILGIQATFEQFGEVRLVDGRTMDAAGVMDAAALIVRSVTRVGAELLAGSRVRFVGTVTSGIDHVDTAWLARQGIVFASAAGCNARTVAEYVVGAILLLAERLDFDPREKVLGVVGVGRVGSRVAEFGEALGMRVLRFDPPLQRLSGGGEYVAFRELAAAADIVTLHVPLTHEGEAATCDMVDSAWLAALKAGAVFINTSRGEVVCETDLAEALSSGRMRAAVLDVWRNEPRVDEGLVRLADVATPHVAGYSMEAKARGIAMIAEALAEFIGDSTRTDHSDSRGESLAVGLEATDHCAGDIMLAPGASCAEAVAQTVLRACDIPGVDAAFRQGVATMGLGVCFDKVRAACLARREFAAYRVCGIACEDVAGEVLDRLGFQFAD